MKVLQLLPAMDAGGVERGTVEVAAELARRGHEALVMSAGGRLVTELERAGARHLSWDIGRKSLRTLLLVRRLRRLLEREQIDILHPRSRVPAWVAWLAWRGMDAATRPRFVTTVHGFYSVGRYSAIMTRGERVIAVSEPIRRYILDHYPATDPARVELIHRGVDPAAFVYGYRPDEAWWQAWRRELPQLQGRQVLTLAGRLTRLKGHRDFIELIAAARHRGLDVHGLIVGGEDPRRREYAQELRDLVRERGLQTHVTFAGHRADVAEIYAASALVLSLSSKPESFGRTVLEALSQGVPVVGYAHGGVGEVLERVYPHGAVACGDSQALLERVCALLAQPQAVPREQPFTLQAMLDKTLALYQHLGDPACRPRSLELP